MKDFGHGDLKDVMSGVDEVLSKYPVDGNRMGVRGWSYGGFGDDVGGDADQSL